MGLLACRDISQLQVVCRWANPWPSFFLRGSIDHHRLAERSRVVEASINFLAAFGRYSAFIFLHVAGGMYHLLKGLHAHLTRKDEYSVVIIGLDNVSQCVLWALPSGRLC